MHYVSPTVWAWRSGRVKTIKASVDLLLSIFPFEVELLESQGVPVNYIGHPLADEIALEVDQAEARNRLAIPLTARVMALLPGSRVSEIESLTAPFLGAAKACLQADPGLRFLVPLINRRTRLAFEALWKRYAPGLELSLLEGASRDAIASADVVLSASGTATLEALLLKRPMVVAYRVSPFTHWIIKTFDLVKTPHIAMSNLLAGEEVAPEFMQHDATPQALSQALLEMLDNPDRLAYIRSVYFRVHRQLRQNASVKAAEAVLRLLEQRI